MYRTMTEHRLFVVKQDKQRRVVIIVIIIMLQEFWIPVLCLFLFVPRIVHRGLSVMECLDCLLDQGNYGRTLVRSLTLWDCLDLCLHQCLDLSPLSRARATRGFGVILPMVLQVATDLSNGACPEMGVLLPQKCPISIWVVPGPSQFTVFQLCRVLHVLTEVPGTVSLYGFTMGGSMVTSDI